MHQLAKHMPVYKNVPYYVSGNDVSGSSVYCQMTQVVSLVYDLPSISLCLSPFLSLPPL